MFNLDEEKDRLVKILLEQYSRNMMSLEEYERLLEYINRMETEKETGIAGKILKENGAAAGTGLAPAQNGEVMLPGAEEKHISVFSWRTSNVRSLNGRGGKYVSLFGANRIVADSLPKGRTVINVNSIFGLTEIIVPENVKITNRTVPVFSGIFAPGGADRNGEDMPELYITGRAVFGNITIKTAGT